MTMALALLALGVIAVGCVVVMARRRDTGADPTMDFLRHEIDRLVSVAHDRGPSSR